MSMKAICSIALSALISGGALLGAGASRALADEKDFYNGKTVTIIVSTKSGGGYDAYGRLLSKSLPKYLPGSTVIVKNVPGAGHIIGCNEIYRSKPDGLTLGVFNKGLITSQLVEMDGIKFDLRKMSWLGSPATEGRLLVMTTKKPYKTVADLQNATEEIILCSAGMGSESHNDAVMISEILGISKKVKIVPGYAGTEGEMGIMRGEIHGAIGSIDSMRTIIKNGDARGIVVISNEKSEEYPDLPLIGDYAKGEKIKAMCDLMTAEAIVTRPFAAPPGVPPERLKVLRDAYDAAWKDPETIELAKKMGMSLKPQSAEAVSKQVLAAFNQTPEMIDFLKKAVKSAE